jgi:anti-sigma regulatory factor (Ser/Thr protein kinase)
VTAPAGSPRHQEEAFRHLALLYDGDSEFLEGTVPFIREGVQSEEPVLVVVDRRKIDLLRSALDGTADCVQFADMADVGLNPARIIPAWRDFIDAHAGGGHHLRGIGEPIWATRNPDELTECQRHEALLNVAFAGQPAWSLLCPYDIGSLPPDVIDEAHRSHPLVVQGPSERISEHYRDVDAVSPFDGSLPEAAGSPAEHVFALGPLEELRAFVRREAAAAGLSGDRIFDLVVAVNEVTTNSLCHGGGMGMLRIWQDNDTVVCEVRDKGVLADPLLGRLRPTPERATGRGLWLANQLCELVQLRSSAEGTVVRLHMRRD